MPQSRGSGWFFPHSRRRKTVSEKFFTAAVVSALEKENNFVSEYLAKKPDWSFTDGAFQNQKLKLRLHVVTFGVGKVNAGAGTAETILKLSPDCIVNIGLAGGFAKGAKRGDMVIGTEYVQVDFHPYKKENISPINPSPSCYVELSENAAKSFGLTYFSGKIATGDFFLHDNETKRQIQNDYSPVAFDMESAAIAQTATHYGTPFISIRTFSDLADNNAVESCGLGEKPLQEEVPVQNRNVLVAVRFLEELAARNASS